MNSGIASPLTALHRSIKALEVDCNVCAIFHAKAVSFLRNAVDRAVRRSPAACPEPAEGQIIHPASEYKALENVDRVLRCTVRQLYAVNGRYGFLPDIGAVIAPGFPEKRMISIAKTCLIQSPTSVFSSAAPAFNLIL